MTAPKRKPKSGRNRLVGAIHVMKTKRGLDDDTYRDLLERVTGKRSCADMSMNELGKVMTEMSGKAGQVSGNKRILGKVWALWYTLYNLGVISEPSQSALTEFAKRVTGGQAKGGIQALTWLDGDNAEKVIEAMKSWAARPVEEGGGGVNWDPFYTADRTPIHKPRVRVLQAQWRRLIDLGWAKVANQFGLSGWLQGARYYLNQSSEHNLDAPTADRAIQHLGRIIRRELEKRSEP